MKQREAVHEAERFGRKRNDTAEKHMKQREAVHDRQKAKRYGRETESIHLETQALQDELLFGVLAIRTVVTTVASGRGDNDRQIAYGTYDRRDGLGPHD